MKGGFVISIGLLMLVSQGLYAQPHTQLIENVEAALASSPPEWQDGDDEEVTTTVGAMRRAIWYYETREVLSQYARELVDTCIEASNSIDTMNGQLADAQNRIVGLERKNRALSYGLAATVGGALIYGIVHFLTIR